MLLSTLAQANINDTAPALSYRSVVQFGADIVAYGPEQSLARCLLALENLKQTTHPMYYITCKPSTEVPLWGTNN